MSRKTLGNNLTELLKTPNNIFSINDLGVLWGIFNKQTLTTTAYRYCKKGLLHRIKNGLYSKVPINSLDYKEMGCAVFGRSSYLSTESVLSMHGVIAQGVKEYTFVGEASKNITIGSENFLSRKMASQYLLNRVGVVDGINYSEASLERAVSDLLYYSPKYYFDNERLINWDKVKELKSLIGY